MASKASLAVAKPATTVSPRDTAWRISEGLVLGVTMKRAPIPASVSTSSLRSTVPAPIQARAP